MAGGGRGQRGDSTQSLLKPGIDLGVHAGALPRFRKLAAAAAAETTLKTVPATIEYCRIARSMSAPFDAQSLEFVRENEEK